jgi:hypothetical protein
MPQDRINFGPNQASGFEELGGAQSLAMNVVIDDTGTVTKRPGIATFSEFPSTSIDSTGVIGLYQTYDGKYFAVGNDTNLRNIYRVDNGSFINISQSPNQQLNGKGRPIFTETEVFLVAAGGANIQKVKKDTVISSRLGGNPPFATHVAANSSRLLANDTTVDRTKVRFSGISQGTIDTSGHERWDNTGIVSDGGFFTAEARPDEVIGVYENTNEVFVFGQDNVQIFVPDPTPLVFVPAVTREFGLAAPYSVIRKDQEFLWIDQYRRIVYSDGRTFETIEKPIKKQLDSMTTVADAFGYRVLIGHIDCFVWTFPTDGRTFAFQMGGGWSQWAGYSSTTANFIPLKISAHHLSKVNGKNFVGTTEGKLGVLSQSQGSDLGDLVVARATSGFIDRKTDNRKLCRSIKIACRRGESSTRAFGTLEWRDSHGAYGTPLRIDFGTTGDDYVEVEFRSLGTYRRRDWRFTFSDSSPNLSLVKVTETFDILGT